jgi:uncharacterized RDD family membrane protein YckC
MSTTTRSGAGEIRLPAVPGDPVRYVGLATRVIAFVIDAAIISVVGIVVGVGAALIQGVLHLPSQVQTIIQAIGAGAFVLGTVIYFVAFWTGPGQTPGARVMRIRVVTSSYDTLSAHRALLRVGGVVLAALPLFAGFALILFDSKRRGLQDRLARTLVTDAPELSVAQSLLARRRAAREAVVQPSLQLTDGLPCDAEADVR